MLCHRLPIATALLKCDYFSNRTCYIPLMYRRRRLHCFNGNHKQRWNKFDSHSLTKMLIRYSLELLMSAEEKVELVPAVSFTCFACPFTYSCISLLTAREGAPAAAAGWRRAHDAAGPRDSEWRGAAETKPSGPPVAGVRAALLRRAAQVWAAEDELGCPERCRQCELNWQVKRCNFGQKMRANVLPS